MCTYEHNADSGGEQLYPEGLVYVKALFALYYE